MEIFIDLDRSGRHYYELEINPANVVCDLRMIAPWPDKEGDIDWDLEGLRETLGGYFADKMPGDGFAVPAM